MKKILLPIIALCMAATAFAQTRSAVIAISSLTKYQYIDGFGGTGMNGQWADVYTQQKVNALWGQGDGQIGLNIMRVRINPNEGNWGEYGNPIKWARKINPDVQVFATPWTPPKKFKTHNTNKYQNDFGTWVWPLYEHTWGGEGSNGGAIDPAHIEDYALFLEKYRKTMQTKGCPIDMISIQNECDYTPTATDNGVEHASYESCIFSPKEMSLMVKAARAAVDPSCKIMGPETFGWGQATYNDKLITYKDATDNIDVYGNHLYGSNDLSFINRVTSKTKKHMWMTEFLIDYKSDYKGEFSAEYEMVKSIEDAMKNGYNGYVYYNMLNDFFACNHGGSDTQLWKRAYIFGQYARHATGRTRIKSTLSGTYASQLTGGSSYMSASGDTITMFILNPTKNEFSLTASLPLDPTNIKAVVTGESVNMHEIDLTDTYTPGTKRVKLTLLPGMFYTFVFEKRSETTDPKDVVLANPVKPAAQGNPINPYQFIADPTSIEYNGRLYVYGTNDQQEFDVSKGLVGNSYGKITQLVCMSTADMVNWTNHGIIDVKKLSPWIYTSWAPSIISRVEADSLTHFYLYYTNSAAGIGVLTSTSPTGPWTDPLGHALIDSKTPGLGNISQIIDPGAAITPDGTEAYLTFGGGDVKGTELQPGNARIVKLGKDLISLDGDIKPISAPCHFEANELAYMGKKWVYSYCTRWNISDWKSYSATKTAPTAASIVYMTATDPLEDKWTYQGEVLSNPGKYGFPYGNNHAHIQKFGTSYYILYHSQWLENQIGISGGYRNLHMNRVTVVESYPRITTVSTSQATINGVSQMTANRPYAFSEQNASMIASSAGIYVDNVDDAGNTCVAGIQSGDWTMVRGISFPANGEEPTAKSVQATLQGKGTMEVRIGKVDAEPVATIAFDSAEPQNYTAALNDSIEGTQSFIYFVFTSADSNTKFHSWQFSEKESSSDPITIDDITDLIAKYLTEEGTVTIDDITALIDKYLKQ